MRRHILLTLQCFTTELQRHSRHCSSLTWGGGPGAVVKAACLNSRRSRVRIPLCHSSFKKASIEVACSASDRQGSNFESCVWRTVSSQSSLSSEVAQTIMDIFRTLGSRSLSVTAVLDFSGNANTSIHGLGEDDTATTKWPLAQDQSKNKERLVRYWKWAGAAHILKLPEAN